MVFEYKWRNYNQKVSAQKAGEFFEELEAANGYLSEKMVLEASRPEDALLHKCFDWDDSSAAEKYRLSQAHIMLANIVKVAVKDEQQTATRAFVNVNPDVTKKGWYRSIQIALEDENDREVVLAAAKREMSAFIAKYKNLKELSNVIKVMEENL